jgi:hypothetical protein
MSYDYTNLKRIKAIKVIFRDKAEIMMKKIILSLLLSTLVSVYLPAETLEQGMSRVDRMSDAVLQARIDIEGRRASDDQIGAFLASHDWVIRASDSIARNGSGLSQDVRNKYIVLSQLHTKYFDSLLRIVRQMSSVAINNIFDRAEYWSDYLDKGGVISFR